MALKRRPSPRLAFQPKLNKIVHAILYLVTKLPGLDHYQVVKLLYLADREHLNRYGRPLTFDTYWAMENGPVASNALHLIKGDVGTLRKAHLSQLPVEMEAADNRIILKRPLLPVDTDQFSKSDLAVLDDVIARYGRLTFDELYDLTHEHTAYVLAWDSRPSKTTKSAQMHYEDLLSDDADKEAKIEALEPIASRMR